VFNKNPKEWIKLAVMAGVFAGCWFLPPVTLGNGRLARAVTEALGLTRWYARAHVLLCLVPALFIAGAISVFVSQASVMKYLGAGAKKVLAYGVASVSGGVLAVCSCTVLPLFAGIYRMGAGLGPAVTFLYAGPAINVLAIVLTARVLGVRLGVARAGGAIVFSVVIGLCMHLIFRGSERAKAAAQAAMPRLQPARPLWQNAAFFAAMVGVLVFANWARAGNARAVFLCCDEGEQIWQASGRIIDQDDRGTMMLDDTNRKLFIPARRLIRTEQVAPNIADEWVYRFRWAIVAVLAAAFAVMIPRWFRRAELAEWMGSTWGFAKQILPLLLIGVLVAGFLLGRPESEGLIPARFVERAVGGNSLRANLLASVAGALMYFATLTEVPIVGGLLGAGMGHGPALALLLAGPALSLPNMLVIRSVMGTKRTAVYVLLVIVMSTASGVLYGAVLT